jgi:hypothetical protein
MTKSKHNVLDPEWEQVLRRGQEAEGEAGSVDAELAFVHLLRHAREPEALCAEQLDAIWSDIQAEVAPAGEPWWRKAWVWWSAPAIAAAAVLFVVVVDPASDAPGEADEVALEDSARYLDNKPSQQAPGTASDDDLADASADEIAQATDRRDSKAKADSTPRGGGRNAATEASRSAGSGFETSFARLAPHGRATISVSVDHSRDELRARLLATAQSRQGAG